MIKIILSKNITLNISFASLFKNIMSRAKYSLHQYSYFFNNDKQYHISNNYFRYLFYSFATMYKTKYFKYKNKYLNFKSKLQTQNGGAETYYIHDNGGKPLKCIIENENTILIHKQKDFDSDEIIIYEMEPSLKFHPKKIFIGKSPLNKMTEFSGGHGPEFDGNTILLDMGDNEYIIITGTIWSFDAKSKIIEYVSPVGNNDVPYPYAIDDNKNIYLIDYNVVILYRDDIAKLMKKYDNPYDYYRDYSLITSDRGLIPPQLPKSDMNISEWIVGKNEFTLSYEPFPDKTYDRLTKQGTEHMYTIDSKGNKTQLTKKDYIDLMKKFAELQSFEPLPLKKEYMDRDIGGTLLGFYMNAISQV